MKLESFFEKFDQFADAPDAVAKMRELVLELAVVGNLTERDADSERVNTAYVDEPTAEYLPVNWRVLNFGKFCDIQGGNQPPKSQFISEPRPGYVRLFQIRDLGESPVPVYIPRDTVNRFSKKGEILIGRYGASVGKVFWAQDGAYNVALAKFIFPEDALFPAFAFWVLKSHFFQDQIAGASRSAQAGFNKGDLAAIDFPLPPLAEQKRIVAKVNELMALCDRLEAQQQQRETRHAALARASLALFAEAPTPANLNFLFQPSYTISPADLRKSILTLAVQGKLVPQDPDDEPAQELLQAIQEEKQLLIDRGLLKRVERIDFDPNETSDVQPTQWRLATLAATCVSVTDGDHLPPPKAESGIPFLVISNVRWGGINFEGCRYVSEDYFNKLDWIRKPLEGDILYTLVGSFGIPVVVRGARPFCVQRHIGILRPSKHIDRDYLADALASDLVLQQVTSIATGIAQKTVPLAGLRRIKIPLPPLAEQRRIVAKVDQLMTLLDQLETQLAASRATGANLVDAIVSELAAAA
jgi:type I restriction enzyme S subunit